nr:hypothetical protein [Candidatus Anoxychlamydiales bacterium]
MFIKKIKKTLISIKKVNAFLFFLSLFILKNFDVFAVIDVNTETELINAIKAANITPEQINFTGSITLTGAPEELPAIKNSYTIDGASTWSLNGGGAHRGFVILGSGTSTINATIQNITITSTLATGGAGGNNFQDDGGSGGGGLGAGGAIYVGDTASVTLDNVTYTTNDATGGASPDPDQAVLGNSGGGGGGGLGGNGATVTGNDGTGGGGPIAVTDDASGSTGGGVSPYKGGDGAQESPAANAGAGEYGSGGGGAANTASTATSNVGGFGGGGGAGAGNLGNATGSDGGFGAGGGGGGADAGTQGGTIFGGGSAQDGAAAQGGRGGGGAALGGAIFIDDTSTATIIESTSYPFTTTNSLNGGAGHNAPTVPSELGQHIFLASGGNLTINTSGTFTLTQPIEADSINSTGGIEIDGSGTVNLSGSSLLSNTFRGDLTITEGTVQYNAAVSLGNGTGITFPAAGLAPTKVLEDTGVISVVVSNPITMTGDGTLRRNNFGSTAHNMRISSAIVGAGRIRVTGIGSIKPLVASPSFSGGWNIDGETGTSGSGNLVFDSPDVLGTGSIQIRDGNYSPAAQRGGVLMYRGTSNNSLSNNIELPSGDGAIVFGVSNSTLTLSGIISGVGNLTFDQLGTTGSCILTNNSNSYGGTTTILDGTVHSNVTNAISNSSSITVTSPGILQINNVSQTIKDFGGSGTLQLNQGSSNTLTVNQTSSLTHSGSISGDGKFEKEGGSTLTLSSTSALSFTGSSTITAGILELNSAADLIVNSSAVTIDGGSLDLFAGTGIKTINNLGGSGGALNLNDNSINIDQSIGTTYSGIIIGTGNVTKQGAETLTLEGTNTYNGTTTISAGSLALGTGGTIASSSSVTVNGTLTHDQAATTKIINTLSGAGSIVFNQAAGILNVVQGINGTFSGGISGTGAITKAGASTLTLSGTNTHSNGTNIDAGTLSVSAAGNLASNTITLTDGVLQTTETMTIANDITLGASGTNTKALEVSSGKTATISGTVTSAIPATEVFSKTGTGTLSINSVNAGNTGTTTIAAGTMLMQPSAQWSADTFNISSGANLTGTGTDEADVTNAGSISPGESIGTLIIDGSYTENGTLEIEITSTPNDSDKVQVIGTPGTVTLNPSSTLSVIPLSSTEFFLEGTEYVIITAAGIGGVTGTFGSVIDPDSRLEFSVRYDANQVVLIMSDSALILPINDITNPNAKAVANYLDSCNFTNPDFVNILVSLSSLDLGNLTDALLQISPARFGALQLTNYTNNQTVSRILTDHLRKLYHCACKENRDEPCIKPKTYEFWVEPFSYFTHQTNLEDQRPFKNKVFGAIMGSDFNFSNHINFGGAGGYSYADIDWRNNLGYAEMHTIYGSLHASNYNHSGFINASITGSGNFYKTKRKIRFADVSRSAKSKHAGFDINAHAGSGLDFLMANDLYFQPTLDIDYTYVWQDGFKERGANALNLIVDTSNFYRLRGVALLNFIKDFKITNRLCISPALRAGYAYEEQISRANITSRLEGVSCTKNKFTVQAFHKNHSKGIVGANI